MTALPGTTPNTIIKFATDTPVVRLINNNDETAYWEEVGDLAVWCQDNNLSLNVIKTKEMIVDYRKKRTELAPIVIDGAVVEQVPWWPSCLVSTSQTNEDGREECTTNSFPPPETKKLCLGA